MPVTVEETAFSSLMLLPPKNMSAGANSQEITGLLPDQGQPSHDVLEGALQRLLMHIAESAGLSWTVILIIMVGATCSAFLIAFVVCLFTLRKKWRRENQRMSDIVEIQSTGMKNTSWNGHLDHKYGSETGRPALGLTTSAGCERSISSGFDSGIKLVSKTDNGSVDKMPLANNMEDNEGRSVSVVSNNGSTDSAAENNNSLGKLNFTMEYDCNKSTLFVTMKEAVGLPAVDSCGTSDPYVKLYILPEKKPRYETKVHLKSLNPVFDETFRFTIFHDSREQKTLVLTVYDFNRFSKDELIGEVRIPMDRKLLEMISSGQTRNEWRSLCPPQPDTCLVFPEKTDQLGNLCLSLSYIPPVGRLTVTIIEARDLKKMDVVGLSDPYVKIALMLSGKLIKKAKTTRKKCTLNPTFNEVFIFDLVPFDQIQNITLVLTVMDYDRIGSSERIGKVVLSPSAVDAELRHWNDMLASPRETVQQWHALVPCW